MIRSFLIALFILVAVPLAAQDGNIHVAADMEGVPFRDFADISTK